MKLVYWSWALMDIVTMSIVDYHVEVKCDDMSATYETFGQALMDLKDTFELQYVETA